MPRSNLCINPAAKWTAANWFGNPGSGRVAGQSGFPDRTTAYRNIAGGRIYVPGGSVVAGQTYTISCYIKPSYTGTVAVVIDWYTGDTYYSSSAISDVPVFNGTVTRVAVTAVAPATLEGWLAIHGADTVVATQGLHELGSVLGTYFDGDSPGADWDGADGESRSTLADVPGGGTVVTPVTADAVATAYPPAVNITGGQRPLPEFTLPAPAPIVLPRWAVYVRDTTLARVAQVDDHETLEMVARFNAVGDWTLKLDRRSRAAAALFLPGYGLEVTRDGAPFMAGPITRRRAERDRDTNLATVSGVDDMVWLRRRLAHPQPTTAAPPYSSFEYDVRTGLTSTVIRAYVDANAGPGALTTRRVTGLTLPADPLLGTTITGRARWQILLELLQELALAGGGVGFQLRQTASALPFTVYTPVDRTATIKFSEGLGNLAAYTFDGDAPEVTYVVVGGGGEGTARTIVEGEDGEGLAGWGRIEQFVDRRDTTVTTEMYQKIVEVLAEGGEKASVSATPIDSPSMRYGVDYNLGDKVTVVLDEDITVTEIVRDVKVELTGDGQRVTPGIGTPGRRELLRLLRSVRDLSTRLTNLERR